MNKLFQMTILGGISTVMTGCAFNPEVMPISQRDQAVYVDAGAPTRGKEVKAKVAVCVLAGNYKQYPSLGGALESSLSSRLSKFAFFDLIDRGASAAILKEMAASANDLTEVDLKGVESDFVVAAKVASIATRSVGDATAIDAQFDFSWVSMGESQKVIMKKSITPTVRDARTANDVEGILRRAAEKASSEFAQAISSKYAPHSRVLQTRGSGQAARINMGDDYGLADGMDVEFYEIIDHSAQGGDARDRNVVARGVVRSVESNAAWVEVSDFERVNVRIGTYVRVLEQKENVGTKLMEKTGWNELL